MKTRTVAVLSLCLVLPAIAQEQKTQKAVVAVTADNFTRAESDKYFADVVKDAGGLGKFRHRREMMSIDHHQNGCATYSAFRRSSVSRAWHPRSASTSWEWSSQRNRSARAWRRSGR
jgi:hypothetical protein